MSGALPPDVGWGLLLAVRVFAISVMQPVWRAGLGRAWFAISVGLALGVGGLSLGAADATSAQPETTFGGWVGLAVWEGLFGVVVGALASLPGHAFMGAVVASAKLLRTPAAPLMALLVALVLASGLALDVHHALFAALVDQGALFAVGHPEVWLGGGDELAALSVDALGGMLVIGLAFVTPVLLAQAVVRTVLGLVARGPSSVGFLDSSLQSWAAASVSMISLGVSWSVFAQSWTRALLPAAL